MNSHQLSNGLTIVFEAQPWQPGASFELFVPAGAINEREEWRGSSTVLEDWLYRGAGKLDSRALSDALDDLGLRRGGGAGLEGTTFSGALLANDLFTALEHYANIIRQPHLNPDEFEACQDLARQDLDGLEDSPAQKMFYTLRATFFSTPHGRSSLGTKAGLEALTAEKLREDWTQRFSPQGAVLGVAGGVGWDALVEKVSALFGDWSGDAFESPAPRMHGETYAHITQDTAQEQIGMMIPDASASLEPEQWGWYESRLALGILSGGGFSSRLMQEVREKRGLVYSVSASGAQVRGGGYVTAYAGTTPDRAQETVDVMLEEFNKMSLGVSTDELERSRVSLLTSLVMSEESSGARARSLARDQVLLGRIRNLEDIKKGIQNVTLESVNRWLAQYPFQAPAIMTLGPKALEMKQKQVKA